MQAIGGESGSSNQVVSFPIRYSIPRRAFVLSIWLHPACILYAKRSTIITRFALMIDGIAESWEWG